MQPSLLCSVSLFIPSILVLLCAWGPVTHSFKANIFLLGSPNGLVSLVQIGLIVHLGPTTEPSFSPSLVWRRRERMQNFTNLGVYSQTPGQILISFPLDFSLISNFHNLLWIPAKIISSKIFTTTMMFIFGLVWIAQNYIFEFCNFTLIIDFF